jgi:hypothetical protein
MPVTAASVGLGDARAGRGGHPQQLLGTVTQSHHPGQQHLLEAGRQHPRAAVAGEQELLGEERVALRTGIDVVDQPGGRLVAEQAGQLLGQLGAGEPRQVQPPYAAVAGQLTEQPVQWV